MSGGAIGRDLMASARSVRALLSDSAVPGPLAALLRECGDDAIACERLGAQGIEQALSAASREAFGPPRFVHFDPTPVR
ncbi:hypothetical protein D9M68_985000 [compost metagenome]